MANTYKVTPILISVLTANQDVYEVPAATTSIIRSISVYNYGESAGSAQNKVPGGVWYPGTEARTSWMPAKIYPNPHSTKFEFLNSSNSILLVLEEADKLQVTCSTTGGLNLIVSVLEISR